MSLSSSLAGSELLYMLEKIKTEAIINIISTGTIILSLFSIITPLYYLFLTKYEYNTAIHFKIFLVDKPDILINILGLLILKHYLNKIYANIYKLLLKK